MGKREKSEIFIKKRDLSVTNRHTTDIRMAKTNFQVADDEIFHMK